MTNKKGYYGLLDFLQKQQEKPKGPQKKYARSIEEISKQTLTQRDSMVRNGFSKYEFIANRGCCDICAKLNGKHFAISKLKIGVNAPPMHEGCRCSIASYMSNAEYEAWLNHLDKGGTTADWEKAKKKKK